jgi:hypothetical protein
LTDKERESAAKEVQASLGSFQRERKEPPRYPVPESGWPLPLFWLVEPLAGVRRQQPDQFVLMVAGYIEAVLAECLQQALFPELRSWFVRLNDMSRLEWPPVALQILNHEASVAVFW